MLSPKPPANVFPSTDIRQRKKDKLSKESSDLSNLEEKNLQTHEPPRLIQPRRHKDLHSSSQYPLSNAGVAAPIAPVDKSPPALVIKPSTSTVEIVQNIIDQLLVKIVEGPNVPVNTNMSRQKICRRICLYHIQCSSRTSMYLYNALRVQIYTLQFFFS